MTIFLEAIQRFIEVPVITNPKLVLIVGAAGLASNILGLVLFHEHGHSHGGAGHSHGIEDEESALLDHDHNGHTHSHGGITEADVLGYNNSSSNNNKPGSSGTVDIPDDNSSYTKKILDDAGPISEVLPSSYVSRISDTPCDYGSTSTTQPAKKNAHNHDHAKEENNEHSHDHSHSQNGENDHNHSHHSHPSRPRALSMTHSNHFHTKPKQVTRTRSANMEGVFLHVLGDALGNVGVMATALIIWKTDFSWRYYMDPTISLIITCIILKTTLPLFRRTSAILLQAVPQTVDADEVKEDIVSLPGVNDVHELHIWILREDLYVATLHVSVSISPDEFMKLAQRIRTCMNGHGIASTTIQPEFIPKSQANSICGGYYSGSTSGNSNGGPLHSNEVSTGGLSAVNSEHIGPLTHHHNCGNSGENVGSSHSSEEEGRITPTCVLQGNHSTGGLQKVNSSA